jgi:hypothetical protein
VHRPVPEPPQVTVAGAPPTAPPPRAVSAVPRGLALATSVLLLTGYVALTELDRAGTRSQRAAAASAAAQRAAVRLSLASDGHVPAQHGVAGAPVQDAVVRVGVHNAGPQRVELRGAQVDGTTRALSGFLDAGATAEVLVAWRLRCAEVGTLAGPGRLDVEVGLAAGPVDVVLDLPAYDGAPGLGAAFHLAAVDVCDVLVDKKAA